MTHIRTGAFCVGLFALSAGIAISGGYGGDGGGGGDPAALNEVAGSRAVLTGSLAGALYLMSTDKMTLYTFDRDERGISNCSGNCAANWPPLFVAVDQALANGFSRITRQDGSAQVAHKGRPLYLWVGDKKPGDMTGDGVGGVWHVARP
ncbi:MAG: hypothetical protein ACE5DK_01570 [Paracoccaceae bacterium]